MHERVKTTSPVLLAAALAGLSQTSARAEIPMVHRLPAQLAHEAVAEAVAACAKNGLLVTATVVDPDGIRTAVLRGDGAAVHTLESSYGKALAAVAYAPQYNLDTSAALEQRSAQPGFQVPSGMLFRAGGVTIKLGNEVIGAIGVGGSPGSDKDEVCARAGVDRIRDRLK